MALHARENMLRGREEGTSSFVFTHRTHAWCSDIMQAGAHEEDIGSFLVCCNGGSTVHDTTLKIEVILSLLHEFKPAEVRAKRCEDKTLSSQQTFFAKTSTSHEVNCRYNMSLQCVPQHSPSVCRPRKERPTLPGFRGGCSKYFGKLSSKLFEFLKYFLETII